jgi:hypothetical protein
MATTAQEIIDYANNKILELKSEPNISDALKKQIIDTGYPAESMDFPVPIEHPYLTVTKSAVDIVIKALSHAMANIGPSTFNFITEEVPTGAINGSNLIYITANNFLANSLIVTVNGQRLYRDIDYIITSPNTFSFIQPLFPPDSLKVDYFLGVAFNFVNEETPTGAINGVNVNYTTAYNFTTNSLSVTLRGQKLYRDIDYTITSVNSFQMFQALQFGDTLKVDYRY